MNLALGLSLQGFKIGLLDADLFGPSIPRMMNLSGAPEITSSSDIYYRIHV